MLDGLFGFNYVLACSVYAIDDLIFCTNMKYFRHRLVFFCNLSVSLSLCLQIPFFYSLYFLHMYYTLNVQENLQLNPLCLSICKYLTVSFSRLTKPLWLCCTGLSLMLLMGMQKFNFISHRSVRLFLISQAHILNKLTSRSLI